MSKRLHKFNPATGVTCIECGGHEIEAQHGEPLSVGSAETETETGLNASRRAICRWLEQLDPLRHAAATNEEVSAYTHGCFSGALESATPNVVASLCVRIKLDADSLLAREAERDFWRGKFSTLEAKLREAVIATIAAGWHCAPGACDLKHPWGFNSDDLYPQIKDESEESAFRSRFADAIISRLRDTGGI